MSDWPRGRDSFHRWGQTTKVLFLCLDHLPQRYSCTRCWSGSCQGDLAVYFFFFFKSPFSITFSFLTADLFPVSHMRFNKSSLLNGNAHYSTNRTRRRLIDCKLLTRCKVRTLFYQCLSSIALHQVYCGSGIKMKNSQCWKESLHFRFCWFLLLSAALSCVCGRRRLQFIVSLFLSQ